MKWRIPVHDVVLKALGVLLIVAAVLKGHELLTVPVANKDLWSWRPFLIFQVEFELALGIWLLSGIFKRLAWLVALACFTLFCCGTLYKGLTGAASCGCFGTVHVNPWMTLLAIDLPAVLALGLFRPRSALSLFLPFLRRQESTLAIIGRALGPLPPLPRLAATTALGAAMLGLTTPILALNEPPVVTSTYEILEPETWIGKPLPILEHIDIGERLTKAGWLVLFYHHDCPDCQVAIKTYRETAKDIRAGIDGRSLLRLAFVEMPPYGEKEIGTIEYTIGRLDESKRWILMTPTACLIVDDQVQEVWQGELPTLKDIAVNGMCQKAAFRMQDNL